MCYIGGVRPTAHVFQDFFFVYYYVICQILFWAVFLVWHMFIFLRDILILEWEGLLWRFLCVKKERKRQQGRTKRISPHFLWAITQIKPEKLTFFFLWNDSINASLSLFILCLIAELCLRILSCHKSTLRIHRMPQVKDRESLYSTEQL